MKIATTIGDFSAYSKDAIKCIEWANECGFKYLDFSFDVGYLKNTPLLTDDYIKYLDKIKNKCNELGVKFIQAHAPMGAPITKDEKYENYMFMLRRSIECCAYLGIDNIVVHTGHQAGIFKEESFRLNKEFYLSFLDYAQDLGVKILTENFNKCENPSSYYYIDNVYELKQLIDYINHPNLYVCFDIGHGNMQETSLYEQIKYLGGLIKALHVQDNEKTKDLHTAPFFGTANYDEVMCALKEIGYNGYFTLEADCFFMRKEFRTEFGENKLFSVPLEIKLDAEKMLYKIAKHILVSYDLFEE